MSSIISSLVAPGSGGLGQHCAQLLEAVRSMGEVSLVTGGSIPSGVAGRRLRSARFSKALLYSPLRWRVDARTYLERRLFDWKISKLGLSGDRVFAFSTQAELTFKSLKPSTKKILVSPTVHLSQALEWERKLIPVPLERGWLSPTLAALAEREYAIADEIEVPSALAAQTFVDRGIPETRLRIRPLAPAARFKPGSPGARLRLVYVGALTEAKGIHILLRAFNSLRTPDVRLELIGGTSSSAIARLVRHSIKSNSRITLGCGDPLEALQSAHIFVHASIHDGLGLAPMEALACGLYVIVTDNTGMKDRIRAGVTGDVIPAGSVEALRHALVAGIARAKDRLETTPDPVTASVGGEDGKRA